jgi:hypothetical protein
MWPTASHRWANHTHRTPPTSAQEQLWALGSFPVWSRIRSWYIMATSRNSLVSRLHLHFTFSFFSFRCYWDGHISNSGVQMETGATRISLIKYTFGPSRDTLQRTSNKYYILWVCVCSRSCPACKSHAPCYIAICALSGSMAFFHTVS